MEEFTIFTESNEDMGLLFDGYKGIGEQVKSFLGIIEGKISELLKDPQHASADLREEITKFKAAVDKKPTPKPINISKVGATKAAVKNYRSDMEKVLDRYAKARDKMSFGGNLMRSIIMKPKVYSKEIDSESYANNNRNIRNIERALDWVEKVLIDLFNLIDQDLNILTLVGKVYGKRKIYEHTEIFQSGDFDAYKGYTNLEDRDDDLLNISIASVQGQSDIFTEKATEEIYRIRAFKKKFNYNATECTIEVDGVKYLCIFTRSGQIVAGQPAQTGSSIIPNPDNPGKKIGVIVIGPDFFKINNEKQSEAVIYHEIGHIKYQLSDTLSLKSEDFKKARQELLTHMTKYLPSQKGAHININEIEADAYARAKASSQGMKQALRREYRYQRKKTPNQGTFKDMVMQQYSTIKNNPEMMKMLGVDSFDSLLDATRKKHYELYLKNFKGPGKPKSFKQYWDDHDREAKRKIEDGRTTDYNYRARALSDKKTVGSPVYNESIDLLEIPIFEALGDDPPPNMPTEGDDSNGEGKEQPEGDREVPQTSDVPTEDAEVHDEPQDSETDQPKEEVKESMPKKTDQVESSKNGVRRKKLYVAFIEWAKEYNSKNTFGSIFDKDIFHNVYPFVPEEMRYFYRLANPILCVLSGDLTFFQVSELKKLNAENKEMDKLLIFAATPNDLRVFNKEDKRIYLATEADGKIMLGESIGDTFDLYIQKMIKKGDILNGPLDSESE